MICKRVHNRRNKYHKPSSGGPAPSTSHSILSNCHTTAAEVGIPQNALTNVRCFTNTSYDESD